MRYFLGHYGESPAPVDPNIAERVLARPQARALRGLTPITLEGARERFGARISEEELLLRLTMPAEQVDAMVAARGRTPTRPTAPKPAPTRSPANGGAPLVTLLTELARRPEIEEFRLEKGEEHVVWRRG